MNDLEKFVQESIDNIRKDREITKSLLKDAIQYIAGDETRHEKVGPVAAKYVETLQRSNEQLVKVMSIIQKRSKATNELTDKDKDEIFELIKGDG